MKIKDLLSCGMISHTTPQFLEETFQGVYASDLMSNVLRSAKSGNLFITTLANINAVAVASLCNLPAIVFCEGKTPSLEMITKAEEEEIVLLQTDQTMVEVIVSLINLGAL